MTSDWAARERSIEKPSASLAVALRAVTLLTLVAALLGSIGGPVSAVAGNVAVALVVAAPLARVLFLGVRWFRSGDRRFALAAAALLAVVVGGAALAALAR